MKSKKYIKIISVVIAVFLMLSMSAITTMAVFADEYQELFASEPDIESTDGEETSWVDEAGKFVEEVYSQETQETEENNEELNESGFDLLPDSNADGSFEINPEDTAGDFEAVEDGVEIIDDEPEASIEMLDQVPDEGQLPGEAELPGETLAGDSQITPASRTIIVQNVIQGSPKTTHSFTFTLSNKNGSQSKDFTIKGEGKAGARLNFSSPGTYTYYVTEKNGSMSFFDYDLTQRTVQFIVTDDGNGTLLFDIYVDGEQVEDTDPILTFTNSYHVDVRFYLLNSDNKYLTGGKLRVTDSAGAVIDTWETESKYHTIPFTADGEYTLTQIAPPADYKSADPIPFTIEDGKIKGSSSKSIKMVNDLATGSFSFTKVDANTGKTVSGASYSLYRIKASSLTSEYKTAFSNLERGTIVWDELGGAGSQTSGSDGLVTFSNLSPNTFYVFREILPAEGYQRDEDSVIIKTVFDGNTWSASIVNTETSPLVKSGSGFTWKEYPTKVIVMMRTASGTFVEGVQLTLTDMKTGKVVESWQSGTAGHEIMGLILNHNYKLEQTNRLDDYKKTYPITFSVEQMDAKGSSPIQYVSMTAYEKSPQPMIVKVKAVSLKASKLKKKKATIKASKAFSIANAHGTVSYAKKSGHKNLSINKSGTITVKKGTKKGTYKIKVIVTATGDDDYLAGSKEVTVKVKIKK